MTLDCPFDPFGSGDRVDRGFYVTNYRGVTIDTVRLRHSAADPGFKTITLIARLNRYDGPLVGTASLPRSVSGSMTESVFDVGGAAVPAGSTITFEQVLTAGTGLVFFDLGFETCDGIVETQEKR